MSQNYTGVTPATPDPADSLGYLRRMARRQYGPHDVATQPETVEVWPRETPRQPEHVPIPPALLEQRRHINDAAAVVQ